MKSHQIPVLQQQQPTVTGLGEKGCVFFPRRHETAQAQSASLSELLHSLTEEWNEGGRVFAEGGPSFERRASSTSEKGVVHFWVMLKETKRGPLDTQLSTFAEGEGNGTVMNIKEYFARISYEGPQDKSDFETLTAIFLHHIRSVPFENLSIHCGETLELDLESIYEKIVKKNRGGWCMENNHLLFWALQTMGYEISLLGGYVYNPRQKAYDKDISHLLLKVVIDGKAYIIDGAFGIAYQMWEPMELVSGKDQPQMPGIFRFTEDNGIWYLDKFKRKQCSVNPDNKSLFFDALEDATCKKIFSFTLQPRTIDEFRPRSSYLQTAPDSLFVKKSICSLQTTTGFQALIGWTFTETCYNYKDNMDLVERTTLTDEEVPRTLEERFNIRLDKKLVPVNKSSVPIP